MHRRDVIMGGVAVSALGLSAVEPAAAQTMPLSMQPVEVRIRPEIAPNEVHVIPDSFMLYWTLPGARAIRYMVGVGRPGLYEAGEFYVGAKKEWPSWTPTPDMIRRDPAAYKQYEDGMPGGPNNPLGARALYLFEPGRGDTFLRIHGTNAPRTIGTAVSNGCARLVNDQAVDLYNRVPMRSRVVLHQKLA
ncbi:L,D-transpeptidase [Jannaschia pagri]|uniref:L,D-transpeptidase n=1 Tax=Jannaschia pagri TaxID=2829797 RepID=A0ABQ4NHD4_9RHOB|nr:L,D-transpeptidase [Jannaschia sp. AI_61]GIT93844.1 L,D-transpeptidase [Jannaschia sp. AI_62]